MRVKLWGTRGSVPTPAAATQRFGGNTPCVEVRTDDGEPLILDAGTGLHWLGLHLHRAGFVAGGGRAHLLLTHTHRAHIQGLPFFTPMLSRACSFRVYGAGGGGDGALRRLLDTQMDPAYCPVPNFLDDRVGARLEVIDVDGRAFDIGATRVTPRRVHHAPGVACLGFRLDAPGGSLAYLPDVEYLDEAQRRPALELAAGVDLLIHDAHFATSEYGAHRGHGHCTDADAVALGRDAGAARVVLFHHHPDRDDAAVAAIVAGYDGGDLAVEAATEGTEYALDGP